MHPVDALEARGGVARWQGLADAGVSRRSLGAAVAATEVVRAGRGVSALPHTQTRRVVGAAFGSRGLLNTGSTRRNRAEFCATLLVWPAAALVPVGTTTSHRPGARNVRDDIDQADSRPRHRCL